MILYPERRTIQTQQISLETTKVRRKRYNAFQVLNEKNCQPRILSSMEMEQSWHSQTKGNEDNFKQLQ